VLIVTIKSSLFNRGGKVPKKIPAQLIISTKTIRLMEVPFQKFLYKFWDRADAPIIRHTLNNDLTGSCMTGTGMLTWPVQRRDDLLLIVAYVAIATGFIFVIDSITPLGVMIWILYLIPLFLTVYLSGKYAPLVVKRVFILLMAARLFLSPRDTSIEYGLLTGHSSRSYLSSHHLS
jgi:hypothetical protein